MNNSLSKFSKLLILTALCLLSGLVFSFLAFGIAGFVYQIPFDDVVTIIADKDSSLFIEVIRIVLLFNSLGIFLVPPFLYSLLLRKKPFTFFKLRANATIQHLPLVILLLLSFLPLINVTVEFNKLLVFPEFLNDLEIWMKEAEESALKTTKALLTMESRADLLFNIFLIGIIPAIGEELTFRGVVQQVLTRNSKNHHFGIWLSAIIFSAIHFQFYGFLPRMLLGAFFGYLFFWTKNLWFPIFAHFLNNTLAVLGAYYLGANGMEEKLEKIGTTDNTYIFSIVSLFIFSGLLVYFRKNVLLVNSTKSPF